MARLHYMFVADPRAEAAEAQARYPVRVEFGRKRQRNRNLGGYDAEGLPPASPHCWFLAAGVFLEYYYNHCVQASSCAGLRCGVKATNLFVACYCRAGYASLAGKGATARIVWNDSITDDNVC